MYVLEMTAFRETSPKKKKERNHYRNVYDKKENKKDCISPDGFQVSRGARTPSAKARKKN